MKDPVIAVRSAYYDLLNNAIQYNGSDIPVYDSEADPTGNDFYIVLGVQTDVPMENKGRFISESTILIDIITRVNFTSIRPREIADKIAGKVFALLMPYVGVYGVQDTTDFKFTNLRKESDQHMEYNDTGTKKVVRRLIRFSQTVIELTD